MDKGYFVYGGQGDRVRRGTDACEECGGRLTSRKATVAEPYLYELSGLKSVALVGIHVFRCSGCKVEGAAIPRVGELHRVIADALIHQSRPLAGDELRFLRKNAGFSAQKFSALLRVDPSTLSRVENGKRRTLGTQTDILARAIVVAERGGEAFRKLLLEMAEENQAVRRAKKPSSKHPMLLKLRNNRWAAAA